MISWFIDFLFLNGTVSYYFLVVLVLTMSLFLETFQHHNDTEKIKQMIKIRILLVSLFAVAGLVTFIYWRQSILLVNALLMTVSMLVIFYSMFRVKSIRFGMTSRRSCIQKVQGYGLYLGTALVYNVFLYVMQLVH